MIISATPSFFIKCIKVEVLSAPWVLLRMSLGVKVYPDMHQQISSHHSIAIAYRNHLYSLSEWLLSHT